MKSMSPTLDAVRTQEMSSFDPAATRNTDSERSRPSRLCPPSVDVASSYARSSSLVQRAVSTPTVLTSTPEHRVVQRSGLGTRSLAGETADLVESGSTLAVGKSVREGMKRKGSLRDHVDRCARDNAEDAIARPAERTARGMPMSGLLNETIGENLHVLQQPSHKCGSAVDSLTRYSLAPYPPFYVALVFCQSSGITSRKLAVDDRAKQPLSFHRAVAIDRLTRRIPRRSLASSRMAAMTSQPQQNAVFPRSHVGFRQHHIADREEAVEAWLPVQRDLRR